MMAESWPIESLVTYKSELTQLVTCEIFVDYFWTDKLAQAIDASSWQTVACHEHDSKPKLKSKVALL